LSIALLAAVTGAIELLKTNVPVSPLYAFTLADSR